MVYSSERNKSKRKKKRNDIYKEVFYAIASYGMLNGDSVMY